MEQRTCAYCGKPFERKASWSDAYWEIHNYCSSECRKALHAPVTVKCEFCGSEFTRQHGHKKLGYARFCSKSCAAKSQIGKRDYTPRLARPKEEKPCEFCGKMIERLPRYTGQQWGKKKYCSRECMGKAYQRRECVPCNHCGTPIYGKRSRMAHGRGLNVYCSNECQAKHMMRGDDEVLRCAAVTYLHETLRSQYGKKACAICGFDRFIEYAHIIPRRDGGTVHPTNILPLCPNHHRLFDRGELNDEERVVTDAAMKLALASPLAQIKREDGGSDDLQNYERVGKMGEPERDNCLPPEVHC